MGDRMEMSLDDIIKSTKQTRPAFGRRGRGGARGSGGPRRGASTGGTRQTAGSIRNRPRSRGVGINRSSRPAYARGDVNSAWQHDMFDGVRMGRVGGFGSSTGFGGPVKLLVSNLDFGVSNSDVQELFAEFGQLKSASVHYDRSGRSLGTADVIFERKADAIKAMKQYNGVPLDGRAMNIEIATSDIPVTVRSGRVGTGTFSQNRSQPRMGGGGRGRGRGTARPPRGGQRGGGRRGQTKVSATAEELDAELDAYTNKK